MINKKSKASEQHIKQLEQSYKYNREHLPSEELPIFNPNWAEIDNFIMKTYFKIKDTGDCFSYHDTTTGKRQRFFKSDFDTDTLKLLEMLYNDFFWFYSHPTGRSVSEDREVVEDFIRKKYSSLKENSIRRLLGTFCIDNR